MNTIHKIEWTEADHGMIGIGKVIYDYYNKGKIHKLVISLPKFNHSVEYVGLRAKFTFSNTLNSTHKKIIKDIKKAACAAVGIPMFRIIEKSRDKEIVWARYMVFWYVNKYLKYSLQSAGDLFAMDHASTLHGIREFNKDNKYMKDYHIEWKKAFLENCSNANLM